MKLVKSLALGSAAAFIGMTGAQAADLPGAEPVEYVKVCDAYGAGFFYIPGSDTCLNIGGFVRFEASVAESFDGTDGDTFKDDNNSFGTRTRARLWFDARTETEYGTLRTYIRLQFQRESGGSGGFASTNADATGDDQLFDKAFIQFAGLTAGVTDSFWDFKPYATFYNPFVSDRTLPLVAYTLEPVKGFSASVALEDSTQRRRTSNDPLNLGGFPVNTNTPNFYGKNELPDLVANLRVKQGWGEVQLSGFLRQLTANEDRFGGGVDDELGWGVMGGAKINLDSIAKGDYIWGSAAYAEGGLSYVGLTDQNFGIGGTGRIYELNQRNDFNVVNGKIELSKASAFNLGLLHYWSPKWRSALQGSYIKVDYDGNVNPSRDWDAFTVGGNIIWSPVKKLDIGLEVVYANTDYGNNVDVSSAQGRQKPKKDDAFTGRFRIQRDF